MSTYYFVPGGTNSLSSAGNWSATRLGATGVGPPNGAGDVIYLLDGEGELSSIGLNQLSLANNNHIEFGPQFAMSTPEGTTLDVQCANGTAPQVRIESSARRLAVRAVASVSKFVVRPQAGTVILSSSGSPTIPEVDLLGGSVIVRAGFTPTVIYSSGMSLSVFFEYGAAPVALLEHFMGRVVSQRAFTTLLLGGDPQKSRVIIDARAAALSLGTVNQNGGLLNYRSDGTITVLNMRGGVFTPKGAPGRPTITTANLYGSNDNLTFITKAGNVEVDVGSIVRFGDAQPQTDNGQFQGLEGF